MPRVFGHDLLAIIAAAIATYAVGALIYGLLFSEVWQTAAGYDETSFVGLEWKMAFGPVMPILSVLGLAFLINAAGERSLAGHLKIGVAAWAGFSLTCLLYAWVYSDRTGVTVLLIDAVHLLLGALVASAVLLWRKPVTAQA